MNEILQVYIDMLEFCIPFAVIFGFGNLIVSTLLRAAFGGKLLIK